MSRMSRSPTQSPSFRTERPFRTTLNSSSSGVSGQADTINTTTNNPASTSKSVLLSENQLSKVRLNCPDKQTIYPILTYILLDQ